MTPPPGALAASPPPSAPSPPPPAGAPTLDAALEALVAMGFPRRRAADAISATGGVGVEAAAAWLLDAAHSPLARDRPDGAPAAAPPARAPAAPAAAPRAGAGVDGILRREAAAAESAHQAVDDAFSDLAALAARADEMVALAAAVAARRAGAGGAGGVAAGGDDAALDAALAEELADLGLLAPVTRETAGRRFHRELARQLADALAPAVERAGGVLPLPDAFRLFNRARFMDLVTPDDLLQAARLLHEARAPIALRELPSGARVLQSTRLDAAAVGRRLAELAWRGAPAAGGGAAPYGGAELPPNAPWAAALGPGVSRAEAAEALGVPLALAGEHLAAAEAAGLLCRDDGPTGLRFFPNFFVEL